MALILARIGHVPVNRPEPPSIAIGVERQLEDTELGHEKLAVGRLDVPL